MASSPLRYFRIKLLRASCTVSIPVLASNNSLRIMKWTFETLIKKNSWASTTKEWACNLITIRTTEIVLAFSLSEKNLIYCLFYQMLSFVVLGLLCETVMNFKRFYRSSKPALLLYLNHPARKGPNLQISQVTTLVKGPQKAIFKPMMLLQYSVPLHQEHCWVQALYKGDTMEWLIWLGVRWKIRMLL